MENIKKMEPKGHAGNIPVYCAFDKIVDIAEVTPNPKNPNTHPPEQIELLAKIIQGQGWRAPVTVSTLSGMVVRGHGRLMAAQLLGLDAVPVDYQNYASEDDELADLLADNKISELSEIDNKKLAEAFANIDLEIINEGLTGFSADEVAKIQEAFAYTDVSPDDFGDDFQLRDSGAPLFRTMTFHLDEKQFSDITAAFKIVKDAGLANEDGNSNENGNCLHRVVIEWAEQKKLSLK